MMKKRLQFQMPHIPLKVLRGQQDEEDIQDQYYERFQAPGTSTEDDNNDNDDDDDSRSSLSHEDVTTDVGELSEECMERYLGRQAGAMHSVNQADDHFGEIQNYQNENTPQYDTTGSINQEAADVQAVAQMHHLPSTDVTSNEDRGPLLLNEH